MWKYLVNLDDDARVAASWAGALLVLGILVFAGAREAPTFFPAEARDIATIAFPEDDGGSIVVRSRTGEAVLDPDAHGIIEAVTTVLARERRAHGHGLKEPFVLAKDFMGRFAISDPLTGTWIDLRDFGREDTVAFAGMTPLIALSQHTSE
ncbi:MAG: photosynthetic complex assembly protein PuhC [Pseudomonadota bacterium]